MKTSEMKDILYKKLCDEGTNFEKSNISIKKVGNSHKIVMKGYENIPFSVKTEYDDGMPEFIVWVSCNKSIIVYCDSMKDYPFADAMIELGYYIGTRF